jgi:oxaloacetate decarboxylase alpha subunit
VRGYYGKAPGPMDRDIVAKVLGGEEPIPADVRPGSLVTTTYDEMAAEIGELAKSEEDVLMYALFPVEARQYLTAHKEGAESAVFMLSGEINAFREDESVDVNQIRELIKIVEASDINEVVVEENGATVTVRKGAVLISSSTVGAAHAAGEGAAAEPPAAEGARPPEWREVRAQMVGTFYHSPAPGAEPFVKVGDAFDEGHPLCILEAMKLMNEIEAPENGIVRECPIADGTPVEYGTVLFYYEPTA